MKLVGCFDFSWKNVKGWLGWSSGGPPNRLFSDGKEYTKPSDLTSVMNNFFVNKVKDLRKNLPIDPGDPLENVRRIMRNRNDENRAVR